MRSSTYKSVTWQRSNITKIWSENLKGIIRLGDRNIGDISPTDMPSKWSSSFRYSDYNFVIILVQFATLIRIIE